MELLPGSVLGLEGMPFKTNQSVQMGETGVEVADVTRCHEAGQMSFHFSERIVL